MTTIIILAVAVISTAVFHGTISNFLFGGKKLTPKEF